MLSSAASAVPAAIRPVSRHSPEPIAGRAYTAAPRPPPPPTWATYESSCRRGHGELDVRATQAAGRSQRSAGGMGVPMRRRPPSRPRETSRGEEMPRARVGLRATLESTCMPARTRTAPPTYSTRTRGALSVICSVQPATRLRCVYAPGHAGRYELRCLLSAPPPDRVPDQTSRCSSPRAHGYSIAHPIGPVSLVAALEATGWSRSGAASRSLRRARGAQRGRRARRR